jgi:hypothetical protein
MIGVIGSNGLALTGHLKYCVSYALLMLIFEFFLINFLINLVSSSEGVLAN